MPDVFASVCRLATLKSFVLVLVMLGAIEAFAEQSQSIADVTARDEPPKVGLRVLKVYDGSPAHDVGLKSMDMIVKYGDFAIVDSASYFVAREAMEKFPNSKVEVVYWRGGGRVSEKGSSGGPGIDLHDNSTLASNTDSLM